MKKSICQSRNVISCYANEIEIKGFNAKIQKKKKAKKGNGKQGLIQDKDKTPHAHNSSPDQLPHTLTPATPSVKN